ncbi:alpha/beta hydrolase [Mitsuokella sp. WILCCON 0060]
MPDIYELTKIGAIDMIIYGAQSSGKRKGFIMKHSICKIIFLMLAVLLLPLQTTQAASTQILSTVPVGSGRYLMPESRGNSSEPMHIFTYRSSSWQDGKPVLVVFHGLNRNADTYRDGWIKAAEEKGFLVVCPEFSEEKFPGVPYYNLGHVVNQEGDDQLNPESTWIFPVIDDVTADVRARMHIRKSPVILFAHSAGAQLIHRYVLLGEKCTADKIVIANAGWYTMPDRSIDFPYGIKDVPLTNKQLAKAFSKPVTILLGNQDTKRSKVLRKTPEADAQGMNRLERGHAFYQTAQETAKKMGVPFKWQLQEVSGVGHDGDAMGTYAASMF